MYHQNQLNNNVKTIKLVIIKLYRYKNKSYLILKPRSLIDNCLIRQLAVFNMFREDKAHLKFILYITIYI